MANELALWLALPCLALLGHPGVEDAPRAADNGPCHVCHQDLIEETIARVHFEKGIGCIACHGASTHHMHDEMLMTKPDVLHGRSEVEGFCAECHGRHEDPAKVEAFLGKWDGRDRPNGRVINEHSICTDCHGKHNIVKRSPGRADEEGASWRALFDGESLAPWESRQGDWSVSRGRVRGEPPADEIATLGRNVSLEEFRLYLTFRVTGEQESTFFWKAGEETRAIALRSGRLAAGSLLVDGELVVSSRLPDAVDPEGWNTLSISAAELLRVWVNGKEIFGIGLSRERTKELGFTVEGNEEWARLEIGEIKVQQPRAEPGD